MARTRKICEFDGCDRHNAAHGLCATHAMQKRRGVELRPIRSARPEAAEGHRWCGSCKQFPPDEDFGWDATRGQPKRTCKPCEAARMRDWQERNKEKVRLRITLRTWGLTAGQYHGLFEAQQHRCAICGAERRQERALAIDHDHATGRIRGLLCQDCNMGMGQFADDPDLLEAAARYLRAGGVVHDETLNIPTDTAHFRRTAERDAKRARRRGEQSED